MCFELGFFKQIKSQLLIIYYLSVTYHNFLRRFGYWFIMNGGKKPIGCVMLFSSLIPFVNGGALACGWNVGKLSRKGIVPIVISIGTLKLNDSVPGLTTNWKKESKAKKFIGITCHHESWNSDSFNLDKISKVNNRTVVQIGWRQRGHNNWNIIPKF